MGLTPGSVVDPLLLEELWMVSLSLLYLLPEDSDLAEVGRQERDAVGRVALQEDRGRV